MTIDCERCGKQLATKGTLIIHLQNKKVCEPNITDISREELIEKLKDRKLQEKTYDCVVCKKSFNSRQGKYNHELKCKAEKHSSEKLPEIVSEAKVYNVYNYNNCNITINNPVFVINGLGTEQPNYITEEVVKNLLTNKPQGVHDLLSLKHTNEAIPENHNIRKKVHRDKFIETYDGEKWESKDSNVACKEIFKHIGKDLVEFLNNNRDINLNEITTDEEKQEKLVHSFMDKIGLPLEWYMLFDTDLLKKFKNNYNIDWSDFEKKRKDIFAQVTETVYQFSKNK